MNEEKICELISEEIESNSTKKGIWTKAYSQSEGDEQKTKALYIKYRFDQIKQTQSQVDQENIVKDDEEKVAEENVSNEYTIKLSDRVIKEENALADKIKEVRSQEHYDSGQPPEKFGGFLLFLAYFFPIAIILSPFAVLLELGSLYETTRFASTEVKDAVSTVSNRMIIFAIIWFFWSIYLISLFYKKNHLFPIIYCCSCIVGFAIGFSINLLFAKEITQVLTDTTIGDLIESMYSTPKVIFGNLIQILLAFYYLSSDRAKKTFTQ